jgi:hypothetical protein
VFRPTDKPDTARALRELKPFQRDTVDYVFARMYEDSPPSKRFLVADEVGLGKTIVARGLIARMIDRLWEKPDHRIDIVYICSNGSIARQNLNKLNFLRKWDYPIPDRITMLPKVLKDLECERLNLVSFTPGTSFNLGSSEGRAHERALLYWLLPEGWRERGGSGAVRALMGGIQQEQTFRDYLAEYKGPDDPRVNTGIRDAFVEEVGREPLLAERFLSLCSQLSNHQVAASDEQRRERGQIVGALRSALARTCVLKLEPDLVILDEFQRFKDLLHGNDAASDLARHLFRYDTARVLLLSATPYKMYTLQEEAAEDDHFADFVRTVSFLHDDKAASDRFESSLTAYRQAIFQWKPGDGAGVRASREDVQDFLKRVMVRTERLASSADRNGMLIEVPPTNVGVGRSDLRHYRQIQEVAAIVGYGDVMEFWKSAPYLLNFMEDYDFKEHFLEHAGKSDVSQRLAEVFRDDRSALLDWNDIEAYRAIDPANVRLRSLLKATVERGGPRLLWIPPTLPYYQLGAPFDQPEASALTKYLVFSSWQVVPKVVASLVTHEAERLLVNPDGTSPAFENTPDSRKKEGRLLRFTRSRGRLTGMPVAALLYPSEALAAIGDPLAIAAELRAGDGGQPPTLTAVMDVVRGRVRELLDVLPSTDDRGDSPDNWYWAAPVLLDLRQHESVVRSWLGQADLAASWVGDEPEGETEADESAEIADEQPQAWAEHVEQFRKLVRREVQLTAHPDDLVDVLALLALAGPANVALRALRRLGDAVAKEPTDTRNAAGRIAAGLRSLFNDPAITAFIRASGDPEAYWRRVLDYCAQGCLQSVIDEYLHLLADCGNRRGMKATEFVKPAVEALTLYSATMTVDQVSVGENGLNVAGPHERRRLRTSFAARFGANRKDDAGGAERNRKLQSAFNSPFWPFVLCSTSIGQEGLDFHYYCHAVMHWNLPSNPVDLEQREGRVHRYKGHAVRKNVVNRLGFPVLPEGPAPDPWHLLFRTAVQEAGNSDRGLTPYWLYPLSDGAYIERHIPAIPLSLDRARADTLRRSLALYRMAFGQARQEDVVAFLQGFPEDQVQSAAQDLSIDLSPERGSVLKVVEK